MKPIFLLLGLPLLTTAGACQTPAPNTTSYKFSPDIRKEAQSSKPGANQFAAWDYSYIGEYQAALEVWDGPARPAPPLSAADSLAFRTLKTQDARSYLLQRARTEQIVIINEAHHNPRHRAFTASLLPDLARLGFRYLAVEGIDEQDTLLQKRGYPVLQTGFYTKEPQFGLLLRTALQTGFRLVPYDYGFSHEGEPEARVKGRETAQARNIQRILQADPKARIVVHCGFSHANEGPNGMGNEPAMAAYLHAFTGINPFTIDQTVLTESGTRGGEYARYRLAKAPGSAVFLAPNGQPFAQAGKDMSVDVNVFHPRTTYQAGRPAWVFGAGRKATPIAEPITVGYPCLVLAYDSRENLAQAIPVDVVELTSAQDRKALALGKGRFTVLAKSPDGRTQTWTLTN